MSEERKFWCFAIGTFAACAAVTYGAAQIGLWLPQTQEALDVMAAVACVVLASMGAAALACASSVSIERNDDNGC